MTKNDFTERKIPCREGPKLETYSCTPIVLCGNLIATATCSNSTVLFYANALEETVEPETAAKQERSCENVENGCSTECTWNRTGRSLNPLRRHQKAFQRQPLPIPSMQDHHGRNAMIDILSIRSHEDGNEQLTMQLRGSELRNRFLNATYRTMHFPEGW